MPGSAMPLTFDGGCRSLRRRTQANRARLETGGQDPTGDRILPVQNLSTRNREPFERHFASSGRFR